MGDSQFFFFPPHPTGLKLLLLLGPNTWLAHKGQRGKAAVHKHRVRRAEIQVHEARRWVFSRKGDKKKWQKWKKIIQAVPRSPQDTEEALTPHTNLCRPGTSPAPGLASGTGGKREQEASVQIFYSSHVTLTTELRSIYKSVFS